MTIMVCLFNPKHHWGWFVKLNRMREEFRPQEPDIGLLKHLVQEGYKIFRTHRLEINFASRCSPLSDRQAIASRLQSAKDLSKTTEKDIAVYMFKALSTMGSEEDLLYFLPRALELAARGLIEPDSLWYSHETLLLKKIGQLKEEEEALDPEEIEFLNKFFDAVWIIIISTFPNRKWMPLDFLEEIEALTTQDRFLNSWLNSTNAGSTKTLIYYATDELHFLKDSPTKTWLQSEPVLEKIMPHL